MLIFLIFISFFLLGNLLRLTKRDFVIKSNSDMQSYHQFQLYLLGDKLNPVVPRYKFFTCIVLELLSLRKRYGSEIDTACREIKAASQKDYNENKAIKSEIKGLYFQYIFIGLFTWVFIINFQIQLQVSLSFLNLILLFLWQGLGLFLVSILLRKLQKKYFDLFPDYFTSLYVFKSIITASRPISEAIEKARVSELKKRNELEFIHSFLGVILENLKSKGIYHPSDIEGVISDLWNVYGDQISRFKKSVLVLKLFFITLFIFPGFLITLMSALKEVMVWK